MPVGLVTKHSIDSALATQYGVSIFMKRSVSLVMDHSPMIVDYFTPVVEVSKAAMSRKTNNLYDYIIVTKENKYYGIVTIRSLLNFTTKLEYDYAKQLNPLTGLPGNIIIQSTIREIINANSDCCILYLDLDNFKVYNDNYGFENGDKIIKLTSRIIQEKIKSHFPLSSFVGHIGGDDFICIIENSIEKCRNFCDSIIENFDNSVLDFFNEHDRSKGYIEAMDRKGNRDIFVLTSISISGICFSGKDSISEDELTLSIANVKKEAKNIKGSCYLIKNFGEIV
jgi:diguanylate cyclase (GGDEF)-like protein